MGEGAALRAQELTKVFGRERAVDRLSLEVERGTIFGFIGPSGCGKTTTVRLLTGLYHPTGGAVEVLGRVPSDFTRADRERIGYLPQQSVLYPGLSVAGNMRFAASLYGLRWGRRQRIRRALELVELWDHRHKRLAHTSGGMQRRANLAAVLVHDPELVFLDEPTAGLDPVLRRKVWDHLVTLRQAGRTLFVTTQYVGEAAYCDLVGVMSRGRLLVVDTPGGLRRRAMGGDVIRARAAHPLGEAEHEGLASLPFVREERVAEHDPAVVELVVDDASRALGPLVSWFAQHGGAESIEQHLPPFDDVFVALVSQHRSSGQEPATAPG